MRVLLVLGCFLTAALAQPPVGSRPFRLSELQTQPGFTVGVYAHIAGGPRMMAFGPDGALYVADPNGAVWAVSGQDQVIKALDGLPSPTSLAFNGNDLYVGAGDSVMLFRNATGAGERIASLPTGDGHWTRTVGIGPDGYLYVTAGSTCNFCVETDPRRAAMMRFNLDGSNMTIYATGMRNSVGFAWNPVTGDLWATDNGGDGLGDDQPPDEINVIRQGADYGWPDCSGGRNPVDWGIGARPDRCPSTVPPDLALQAHSAPLGLSFYTGDQFPAGWKNDALVAFHGSWNRNDPTGYKVVRVLAPAGRATGVEDFLWGFFDSATRTQSGRPVHAVTGPDGAVYVSDDGNGNIYRVAYTGPRISPGGIVARGQNTFEVYGEGLTGDPGLLSILANGVPVLILYASPTQVNFVLPDSVSGSVTITLRNEKGSDAAPLPLYD